MSGQVGYLWPSRDPPRPRLNVWTTVMGPVLLDTSPPLQESTTSPSSSQTATSPDHHSQPRSVVSLYSRSVVSLYQRLVLSISPRSVVSLHSRSVLSLYQQVVSLYLPVISLYLPVIFKSLSKISLKSSYLYPPVMSPSLSESLLYPPAYLLIDCMCCSSVNLKHFIHLEISTWLPVEGCKIPSRKILSVVESFFFILRVY